MEISKKEKKKMKIDKKVELLIQWQKENGEYLNMR